MSTEEFYTGNFYAFAPINPQLAHLEQELGLFLLTSGTLIDAYIQKGFKPGVDFAIAPASYIKTHILPTKLR